MPGGEMRAERRKDRKRLGLALVFTLVIAIA
jgi:hypothetical protein